MAKFTPEQRHQIKWRLNLKNAGVTLGHVYAVNAARVERYWAALHTLDFRGQRERFLKLLNR